MCHAGEAAHEPSAAERRSSITPAGEAATIPLTASNLEAATIPLTVRKLPAAAVC